MVNYVNQGPVDVKNYTDSTLDMITVKNYADNNNVRGNPSSLNTCFPI